LATGNQIHVLELVSLLMESTDPRTIDALPRSELIRTFLEKREAETTVLLAVLAEMNGDDQLLRARIARELAQRPPLPDWLTDLCKVECYRAVEMTHILGDGDNVILGVRLANGQEFTCSVYIDHNVGTLVKDAMVIPEPIATVIAQYQQVTDDPDTRWDDISLPDARARIDAAIAVATATNPPFETESWPGCRALVEWVTRAMPSGGTGYQQHKWYETDREYLAESFFLSRYGRPLDDGEHRSLLDVMLWCSTDYGVGGPMKWSPVKVELLLVDGLPRKLLGSPEQLTLAPNLLKAFIQFAHADSGVRADLTAETLRAVDRWAPAYLRTVPPPRPEPAENLAALLDFALDVPGGDEDPALADSLAALSELMLGNLAKEVGGPAELARVHDQPLPDEPFCWEHIPDDVAPRVREVLMLVDGACDSIFDVEIRTASRRLLARVAAGDPEIFRRKGRADTAAAAIAWIVAKNNKLIGGRGMRACDLMAHFGVKGSSSQRATTMLRGGGFDYHGYEPHLGSTDYLTSVRRRRIIELRERYLALDRI
jgi:hypothetical protein